MGVKSVFVCGLYYSGSSAVLDSLSNHPQITEVSGEFDDYWRAGLVGDLVEYGTTPSSRKVLNAYCVFDGKAILGAASLSAHQTSLEMFFWNNVIRAQGFLGTLRAPFTFHERIKRRRRLKLMKALNEKEFSPSKTFDERLRAAETWFSRVKDIYAVEGTALMFDQPLALGRHSHQWEQVFKPFKLVVVVRNPLDQLTDIFLNGGLSKQFILNNALVDIFGGDIEGKVRYQARLIQAQLNWIIEKLDSRDPNFRVVIFENYIHHNEGEIAKLLEFLDLDPVDPNNLAGVGRRFDPVESLANIDLSHDWCRGVANSEIASLLATWQTLSKKASGQ